MVQLVEGDEGARHLGQPDLGDVVGRAGCLEIVNRRRVVGDDSGLQVPTRNVAVGEGQRRRAEQPSAVVGGGGQQHGGGAVVVRGEGGRQTQRPRRPDQHPVAPQPDVAEDRVVGPGHHLGGRLVQRTVVQTQDPAPGQPDDRLGVGVHQPMVGGRCQARTRQGPAPVVRGPVVRASGWVPGHTVIIVGAELT